MPFAYNLLFQLTLYTKPIEQITFADIAGFCEEQNRENSNLDYKENIPKSLEKTIAAMANTWGGIIIIGVEEEDSKPKLPILGIKYTEHLEEQINNIVLGNITPPLLPQIRICQSEDGQKALILIRVYQSNMTPHAIRGNTRVYIRTQASSTPEDVATIERVLWLTNKRRKSGDLKKIFFLQAKEKVDKLLRENKMEQTKGEMRLSICPLYPFESLLDYRQLQREFLMDIVDTGWDTDFPKNTPLVPGFLPTQNGVYGFVKGHDNVTDYNYEEINRFGFLRSHVSIGDRDSTQHPGQMIVRLYEILYSIDLFLGSAKKFYTKTGYWGMLDFRFQLTRVSDVVFVRLPSSTNQWIEDTIIGRCLPGYLEIHKELRYEDITERRVDFVSNLIAEISWSVGFPHITPEQVKELISRQNRS